MNRNRSRAVTRMRLFISSLIIVLPECLMLMVVPTEVAVALNCDNVIVTASVGVLVVQDVEFEFTVMMMESAVVSRLVHMVNVHVVDHTGSHQNGSLDGDTNAA